MGKRAVSLLVVTVLTAMMLLSCGKQDELVGADAVDTEDNIKIVDVLLTSEEYGIGVDKMNPVLLDQLNAYIERIRVDGTFEEITNHYFDASKEPVPVYSAELNDSMDQLVVSTTGDYAPFDYEEGNAYYGIDYEIIKGFADYIGKDLVLMDVSFDIILMSVQQRKCDACIAGITITDERTKYVDFSKPYFETGHSIAVLKDNDEFKYAKTKEDVEAIIKGFDSTRTIAVEGGTTGEDYLRGTGQFDFEGVTCNIKRCTTLEEALTFLRNGDVDCVLGDASCIKYQIAREHLIHQ